MYILLRISTSFLMIRSKKMKANLPFRYNIYTKRGKYHVVFDYRDKENARLRKWMGTGLDESCTKKELDVRTNEIVDTFYKSYLDGTLFEKAAPKAKECLIPHGTTIATGYDFTDFMIFWLDTYKSSVSETTYYSYKKHVVIIVEYFNKYFPDLKLENLKALHLQQFYNAIYADGRTANTVKHYHANIHKALGYAVKMDLIPSNVSDKTERPKIDKFEASFYTKDELQELFKVFKGDKLELIVNIAAYYGLRRSEIIGLKWSAIDFKQNTITIREKAYNVREKGHVITKFQKKLKTKASYRTLPLIPVIREMLLKKKDHLEHYAEIAGKDFNHEYDEYVCTDYLGNIISPEYVSKRFKEKIVDAGLRRIRFHDLRHSCASLLVSNGIPMKAIQEWLGHSTFSITADFYSHLEYNSKIESAEKIAALLSFEENNPENTEPED